MKKIASLFAALFLTLAVPVLPAQMPVGVPMTPAASGGLERIGVVGAAAGKVELTTPGQIGRVAQSGQPIFMGDLVQTDEKGHLQILLLDQTVFTIGPNSAITIDTFVYDPKTQAGEIKASVSKGIFRYVSGKIALKNPDKVKVKLPTATLGFRGTFVGGSTQENGNGIVGLLGPGNNNDAGSPPGGLTIQGQGGDTENLDGTGFGVNIGSDGSVSDPFQLTQDQVNNLSGNLTSSGGGGGGGGGDGGEGGLGGENMGSLSGENTVKAWENLLFSQENGDIVQEFDDETTKNAQETLDDEGISDSNNSGALANSITTFEQLDSIKSGSYHYSDSGSFYEYTKGYGEGDPDVLNTYDLIASWDINFDTKRIENVDISVNDRGVTAFFESNSFDAFGAGKDPVIFDLPKTPNEEIPLKAIIALGNDCGGKIAGVGAIVVAYSDSYLESHPDVVSGAGGFSTEATTGGEHVIVGEGT